MDAHEFAALGRRLRRLEMTPISKASERLVSSAANDALCDYAYSLGEWSIEVEIAGHWGNVEQALSMLPEAIRAAGEDDRGLTRRRVCWQVERV